MCTIDAFDVCNTALPDPFRNRITVVRIQIAIRKPRPHRRAIRIGADDLNLRILFPPVCPSSLFESAARCHCIEPIEMQNTPLSSRSFSQNLILIGGLILYACAFAVLLRNKSFDAGEAVVVLIVFGIVFPLIGMGRNSPCCSAFGFGKAEQSAISRPNRIHCGPIALPDRRSAMD